MSKILGLDLGTNSIGWAIRNLALTENQIERVGVLTFNKGVGIGKSGEYSFAAERTKRRSVRRLYQARKYRLWNTLEVLITEGYCPLSIEDLNKWRHYDKEEARKNNNAGRVYPIWNMAFDAWIKLDFDGDKKPDYSSPYQLRKELAEKKLDFTQEVNRFKLGRALYHIAQRRGFKSSRKGTDDAREADAEILDDSITTLQKSEQKKIKKLEALFSDYDSSVPIGVFLANKEAQGIRIRLDIMQYLVRENYKDEIKYIFTFQGLTLNHPLYTRLVETANNKNNGSIFYKRPLRSQKGLIGKCTLEPTKYRAPISHPAFETFRAWAFLNNIKFRENDTGEWKQLPLDTRQEIYSELFFRKSKSYFPFSEIINFLSKKQKILQLNYSPRTTVTGCPVSARLKQIFGSDYLNVQIEKVKAQKSDKAFYDIEDIWHVLFTYEDQEYVEEFAKKKLKLSDDATKQFLITWNMLPVGYGMLSLNAINKINVFLKKGLIYTEAVLLANVPETIGKDLWIQNEKLFLDKIKNIITENRKQKRTLAIVNNLVSKHKNLNASDKFGYKDNQYKLDTRDLNDIHVAIKEQLGESTWNSLSEGDKKQIFDTVKDCYQAYFTTNGLVRNHDKQERTVNVQSGDNIYYKTESGYYRLPKLLDTFRDFLQLRFNVTDKQLQKIYHPSEISIYPPAKQVDGVLKLGSPKTGSFKNPMAMRALHQLRKLINYLIETNQIDTETRVVVEIARDLNDANKRWAIEAWQQQREAENQEFAEAINRLLSESNNIKASAESDKDIDKIRIFFEQNTEQTLPPIVEDDDQETQEKKKQGKKKGLVIEKAQRWNGHGKNLIDKYRLWKEQGYQCIYTGRYITITDLFDENKVDFEHTLPRSQSFDNSLANLTVCYHDYNRTIKKNQIPTQLLNYDKEYDFSGNIGKCSAITSRLEAWREKTRRIQQQVDFWKTKSKKATDKGWKDDAIRQRHLWQMELEYWKNKLDRFTIPEITNGFKNSQKVDTQLISKYAFHYLKTYFDKVDVQKGSITAEFRKIYQLQIANEKKDRSKHSHHAKDAAVLTLIPVAAQRDAILEKYYQAKENKTDFKIDPPFARFKRELVFQIDDNVLINNSSNNQALVPAKRKVRRRGKEVFIERADGTKVNKWATGDSVRGQLHQETFYGAIKPALRDEKGNILKDDVGNIIQEDKIKYVIRVPFQYKKDANTSGFKSMDDIKKQIVDEGLKKHIEKQVNDAKGIKEAFEKGIYLLDKNGNPHGNRIRHIRVWASVAEPLPIKKQTYLSDKEYKQHYWASNGENFAYGLYENKQNQRGFRLVSLFDVTKLKKLSNTLTEMFEPEITTLKPKAKVQLKYVLTSGLKVIFYKDNLTELQDLTNDVKQISDRLYVIDGFEKDGRIRFSHHLDSRPLEDLKKLADKFGKGYWQGFSQVNLDKPVPRLKLSKDNLNMAVEGYDFTMKMDGTIKWKL